MIIDRITNSLYPVNPMDSLMTSPMYFENFCLNSSPDESDDYSCSSNEMETSWSNACDFSTHPGANHGSENEFSMSGSVPIALFQGVRVKNTVKQLIMQKRFCNQNIQNLSSSEGSTLDIGNFALGFASTKAKCVQDNISRASPHQISKSAQMNPITTNYSPLCPENPHVCQPPTTQPPNSALPLTQMSFFQWQIQQEEERLAGLVPELLVAQDGDGDTFLHVAVAQGRRAVAFVLARKMADIGMLDIKEHNGQSALQVGVAANQHLIVQDLLALGAQVNTADCWGRSVLHVCVEKGHTLTLQTIHKVLKGGGKQVNIEAVNFDGQTPLQTAVLSHNAVVQEIDRMTNPYSPQKMELVQRRKMLGECVTTLLLMGASYGTKDLKSGYTSLHLASREANVELLRVFLDQPDSLSVVNVKAFSGNTALHMVSALHGHVAQVDAVKLLMRRGADPSSKNMDNELPAQVVPEGLVGDQVRQILKGKNFLARSAPL